MDPLLPAFRRQLRARAHQLHPVVAIGHHGLTPSVLHETDVALTAHELIKVRVFSDDREVRGALLARICTELDCAPVQQIGKLLVLWRPRPAQATRAAPEFTRSRTGTPRVPADEPTTVKRRRQASDAPRPASVTPGVAARRRGPPGKAPSGVPRAAAPRRRRAG